MKTNQSSYDIDLEAQVTSEGKPVEVTFTFEPRYPIIGERQDVIGLLGKTKQATTAIVQQAFATLAENPPDRIEFLATIPLDRRGHIAGNGWGAVMKSAWTRFREEPPQFLIVRVKDGPGDEIARLKHIKRQEFWKRLEESIQIVIATALFFSIILFVVTVIRYYMAANPVTGPAEPATV